MQEIEFRLGGDHDQILIDGVPLLDLVREAELPYALHEQLERAEEFAPEPAPLLAGDYSYLGRWTCWPAIDLGRRAPRWWSRSAAWWLAPVRGEPVTYLGLMGPG